MFFFLLINKMIICRQFRSIFWFLEKLRFQFVFCSELSCAVRLWFSCKTMHTYPFGLLTGFFSPLSWVFWWLEQTFLAHNTAELRKCLWCAFGLVEEKLTTHKSGTFIKSSGSVRLKLHNKHHRQNARHTFHCSAHTGNKAYAYAPTTYYTQIFAHSIRKWNKNGLESLCKRFRCS